jgi:hypothetical protein
MFYRRFDRLLLIAGHYISLLLALVVVAGVWGVLAILSLLAGFFAVIAMRMLTDNTAMLVIAFMTGLGLIRAFFSIYVWGSYMGPAVLGVLEAVTRRARVTRAD